MGVFRYEAVDQKTGKKLIGSMQAQNEAHVQQRLQQMGLAPTTIQQSVPTIRPMPKRLPSSGVSVNRRAKWLFLRSLHTATQSGMEAGQALGMIAANSADSGVRQLALGLKSQVDIGYTLSEAMQRHAKVFEPWQTGVIRAGEVGGFLPDMLDRLASDYENRKWIGEFIMTGLWIWFITNVVSIPIGLLFMRHMYDAAMHAAGSPQEYLSYLSHLVFAHDLPMGLLLAIPFIALKIVMHTQRERPWYQKLSHRMPMVARRYRLRALADFLKILDRLLQAGVPVRLAMDTAAGAARSSSFYRDALARGVAMTEQGTSIADSLRATGLVDPETSGYLATAEHTGNLTEALMHIGANLDMQCDRAGAIIYQYRLHGMITLNTIIIGAIMIAMGKGGIDGMFDYLQKFFGMPSF